MNPLNELLPLKDLEIFVMPIVSFKACRHLSSWQPFGLETLARGPLNSPLRRPDLLFAAARTMGLEVALDLECLRRSLWLLPLVLPGQRLFINLGIETLLSPALEAMLARDLPACWRDRVVLELTEGEIPCYPTIRERITWLRKLELAVAIDDVGARGSELERMARLGPVDFVKIDRDILMRSWSDAPGLTRAFLRDVLRAARAQGAELLVEGVEETSRVILGELYTMGIRLGQGYLFGQPTPAIGPSAWGGHEELETG